MLMGTQATCGEARQLQTGVQTDQAKGPPSVGELCWAFPGQSPISGFSHPCLCVLVCQCTCESMCMCVFMCMYAYVSLCACVSVSLCFCLSACASLCMHVCLPAVLCAFVCDVSHVYKNTCRAHAQHTPYKVVIQTAHTHATAHM